MPDEKRYTMYNLKGHVPYSNECTFSTLGVPYHSMIHRPLVNMDLCKLPPHGFNCLGLDINYVLSAFFSFVYRVEVMIDKLFVLRVERICSMGGCGVLTHFGIGAIRWSLCEPIGSPI